MADAARAHPEMGLLVILLLGTLLLPTRDLGVYALGSVSGAVLALNVAGLILVYRSNRVINFAQLAVGSVGALLFAGLVTYDVITRWIQQTCSCWDVPPSWWGPVNFWLCAVIGVTAATVLSFVLYALVVRFLEGAPRLQVALATLFFVPVCDFLAGRITTESLGSDEQIDARIPIQAPQPPIDIERKIGIVTFEAGQLLVVIVMVVLVPVIAIYLRRSSVGIAIRGAADNPTRVASLGVSVLGVTGRVWLLAGLLSGLAGVLSAMSGTVRVEPDGLDVTTFVRVLAIAVIARLTGFGIAAAGAVVLGILLQCVQFSYGTTAPLDGALLAIIAAALLIQRNQGVRADADLESGLRTAKEIRPTPRELRSLPEVRRWARVIGLVLGILVLGAPLLLSPSQTNLASYCLIITIVFLSMLVLTGWAGQISLGQLAFAGAGAWVAAVSGAPFLLALVLGAVAGGVLALVTGVPGLRLRGLHLAIVTLALALSVTSYLLNPRYLGQRLPDSVTRPQLFGMDLDNEQVFYYAILLLVALAAGMVAGMRRSAFARALIAARDNEPAAQSFGINLLRARLTAFAVSGALAGFGGALLAFQQNSVIPQTFSAGESLTVFLFSTLGGLGAVSAPLIAGLVFAVAKLFLSAQVFRIAIGAGGILVLLFASGGLTQVVFGWRDSYLRSVARRRGLVVASLLADERDDGTRRDRLPIKPLTRGRGTTVLIPVRYRLDDQYAIRPPKDPTGTGTSS